MRVPLFDAARRLTVPRFAEPNAGPIDDSAERLANTGSPPSDEELALHRFFLYFLMPLWFVPSIADWWWHKKSDIEHTAGTHESVTHLLMMSAVGVPVTMSLLCDINALVIVAMMGGLLAHEGISYWDVRYAKSLRRVDAIEQHTHSFLEMIPLMALSAMMCLRPKQFAAAFGRGDEPARWHLELKERPLSPRYLTAIVGCIVAFVAAPYTEEFFRCLRVDHTLLPHEAERP
jgi:hypothetical protein